MTTRIDTHEGNFLVRTTYSDQGVREGRGIPAAKWDPNHTAWRAKPYLRNVRYFQSVWPDAGWSSSATALAEEIQKNHDGATAPLDLSVIERETFKLPPMDHQKRALLAGRDKDCFAYLMEQGTGKTKTLLDDAAYNYRQGRIDALIVVAPNSVKSNWVAWEGEDQVSTHMAPDIPYHKAVFNSAGGVKEQKLWAAFEARARKNPGLVIVAVNYEALLVVRCFNWLMDLASKMKVMIAFDESTRLKKPGSIRSKQAKKLRKLCKKVRLLTGTPTVKSPMDAYNQFSIMDEAILGFGSFYAFRNHFCNMGGFQGREVLSYKNLDDLSEMIAPYSFRVTKKQCLNLPDKIYSPPRKVTMTDAQKAAYKEMKDSFIVSKDENKVEAANVLAQIMRLQQITGGYVTQGKETVIELVPPDKNPKVQEAIELIQESPGQVIVWSRFSHEITAMCKALEAEGISFVRYDGTTSTDERLAARRAFMEGKAKVFVGNPQAGGTGLDLYVAETVIYLSNSFSTEDRVQSEDRAHRKGTKNNVAYYDIVVPGTEDMRVLRVIKEDLKVSDMVMEAIEEWL